MGYEQAKLLWTSILISLITYGDVQQEGNSGEFHDEKEYKKLQSKWKDCFETLRTDFEKTTGWSPVAVLGVDADPDTRYWDFVRYEEKNVSKSRNASDRITS